MKLKLFRRILVQVLLLPVVALLIMAVALYFDIRSSNQTVSLIQELDERITQATLVAKLIVDEQSGLRGYQTTGDAQFLEPYTSAQAALATQFAALESVPGANQAQRDHLHHLQEANQTWLVAFATPMIAAVRSGGETKEVQQNLLGKSLMDDVRGDLQAVVQEAQQSRTARIKLWRLQVRRLLEGMFVLALGMGLGIGLFTRNRLHGLSAAYGASLEKLKRHAAEVLESEQELQTTLASIGDGVITCDLSGRIRTMNPVAQELTGWRLHEARGVPLEEVFRIIHGTTRQAAENPLARINRSASTANPNFQTLLLRRDGVEFSIADSVAPIQDKSGTTSQFVLVFRDVTMERRTQVALLATEKLAVAGRLAATIAHEIHNPLDSVSNLLYLMRTGANEEESKRFMSMAEQELNRVTQISRAMLGLYRESKIPMQVNLREMLEEILLLMGHRLEELGVTVHPELATTITVDGFPAELRQVFTNVIMNAADAAGRGGEIWVNLSNDAGGSDQGVLWREPGALIRIRDNGQGIPNEARQRIFEPFFTTKGEHGTGLGLWVSRGIVSKHGGTIRIETSTSETSHGTAVSVFLATKPTLQLGGA